MTTLHVLTPCNRPGLLAALAHNFTECLRYSPDTYAVRWHIAFQHKAQPDLVGAVKNNEALDLVPDDDWVWLLDDDNFVHPAFFAALGFLFATRKDKKALVFSQNRRDELGPVLAAAPENMKLYRVDTAQVVFKKGLLAGLRFNENTRTPDGMFFEALYDMAKAIGDEGLFEFFDWPVVNYNWARKEE